MPGRPQQVFQGAPPAHPAWSRAVRASSGLAALGGEPQTGPSGSQLGPKWTGSFPGLHGHISDFGEPPGGLIGTARREGSSQMPSVTSSVR